MRRVLKNTGSIYVHCDWHASHYIKIEMDKIFGYKNFVNEVVWAYKTQGATKKRWSRKHDVLLFYSKSKEWKFNFMRERSYMQHKYGFKKDDFKIDEEGRQYRDTLIRDIWEIAAIQSATRENIGYPTQKPEALLERIIKASSDEGNVVADFFCGGGTTLAVAQKLKRRFIGCDSSRVAVSVTLDRLVKVGEEMSGVMSNISTSGDGEVSLRKDMFDKEKFQLKLQTKGITEKVPNIEVYYLGVYPVEKFKNLDQEEFTNFVLTAYGASRNTGRGVTHGYKPPAQQEPIYIGPSDPNKSITSEEIKDFFDEIKAKVEPNKMIRAKIIAWRFSRQVLQYVKILKRYSEKHNLPIELEAIPLDSKKFRDRILQRLPDVEEAELFLRFSKPPVIGDIKVKKIGKMEYEFEAVDAISTNEDGWLVNCQWDFDYQEGHFAAHKDYVLSREKKKDKKHGHIFEAILKAKHKFEKEGEYTVACKVQDNLAGETVLSKKISI